ncbi:MAG: response regulator [Clostridia bacterium]
MEAKQEKQLYINQFGDVRMGDDVLKVILEHAKLQAWIYDPVLRVGYQELRRLDERGHAEIIQNFPQPLIDSGFIHADSARDFFEMHEHIARGEKHVIAEIKMKDKDRYLWKRVQYSVTSTDENGAPLKAIGTAESIDIYKRAEESFLQAAKQSGLTAWVFDIESKTISSIANLSHSVFDDQFLQNIPESIISAGLVHPDDVENYRSFYASVSKGEASAKNLSRWLCNQTDWRWKETTYTTFYDDLGIAVKAIGSAVDVTEKMELEDRYQQEIEHRKLLTKDVTSSFWLNLTKNICMEGQCINPELLGFEQDGTVDGFFEVDYLHVVGETYLEAYRKMFNRKNLLKQFNEGTTELSYETPYHMDGSDDVRWLKTKVNMMQNPHSRNIEAFIYTIDVDSEKTTQALVNAVVNMNYDYIALLDANHDQFVVYAKTDSDISLKPYHARHYEEDMVEYARKFVIEEEVEKNIQEMSYANLLEKLQTQDAYTTFVNVKREDGGIGRKKLQFAYLDKARKRILVSRADVTDIYNHEQEKNEQLKVALIAAQQANSAKSEFLSRMSHEIRTPMNTIIGMSALAAQCVEDPRQVSDYLAKVGISARFLLSLINDILDMSRIESGKALIQNNEIPFEDFISNINTIGYAQAQQKGVNYDAVMTGFLENSYIGDAMKLQQILINILSNAIKFTPQGGKVQLVVSQEKVQKDNALVRFVINDTGCGISEDFLPHLFEPFEQQNQSGKTPLFGGSGLGLAICKNLVDLMGGKIKVHSIQDIGSEFIVEVNLGISEESRKTAEMKANLTFSKLDVLIVDDDVLICQQTELILSDMGMNTEWVDSGFKAVQRVLEKQKQHTAFDVVLLDWKMPDMNGIQTAKKLREIVGPDVTIIIMTAYDWPSIEAEAKEAGVNLLISKPLFRTSLYSAFEKVFRNKGETITRAEPVNYDFSGKRLLLVEDHLLNIEVAKSLLKIKNAEVDVAENGLLAIESFAQKPSGYYDAILMDIRMPVMDGLTASKSIRQMRKEDAKTIPIIAMTANAFEEDIEKTKASGMNAHLTKPIEPAIMYQTLQKFWMKEASE